MAFDIGIDLGTTSVIGANAAKGIIFREPSVIAMDHNKGKVIGVGSEVYDMVGRTPSHIQVVRPLKDGVISDFDMTELMLKHLLKKISTASFFKPRVAICVPSGITEVESNAVVKAAHNAGARNVYLIEEPVAAAIGAGIEISRPNGNLIIDIGGGTCDIAVLSLNGIVCKTSLKAAGNEFDSAVIKYVRSNYNVLIGEKTAEQIKMSIGSVSEDGENLVTDVKGRDLVSGLPKKVHVHREQTVAALREIADEIVRAVQSVLEKTPPELVGDIRENGLVLTGGGALLDGLPTYLEKFTNVPARIAENPMDCVAIGTGKSFDFHEKLIDGFINAGQRR